METYTKTFYSEYEYCYFDGSQSSADALSGFFSDYRVTIHNLYDIFTGKVFREISHIEINNSSSPLLYNTVDVRKGDYVLLSRDSNIFRIEKNLDEYIIDNKHQCRKPFTSSLKYDQFMGNSISVQNIIDSYENDIDSLVCPPDFGRLIISPKYNGDTLYLMSGDYLVKTEDRGLLSIHFLDELDDCFKRGTTLKLSYSA